jgi:hypothetical protein
MGPGPQVMQRAFGLLAEGFGLTRDQQQLILRVLWVIAVSGHIAWVCGFLAFAGLQSPFARASELEKVAQAAKVSARISLQQELRAQTRLACSLSDPGQRATVERTIDKLREEYRAVTGGESYPETICP